MTTPILFVTGGLGFIGSNFIHRYLQKNPTHQVINIDNHGFAANPKNLEGLDRCETFNCDILNQSSVMTIFSTFEPYAVVHFAAESHVDRSIRSPNPFLISNVLGTGALLQVANDYWSFCKDTKKHLGFVFIHISTDEVYGSLKPGQNKFTETSRYKPNSPYAASKAGSDHIARAYYHTYGFPIITTHCSNNYGPRQHPEKFIPTVIRSVLEGKKIPVYGTGQNIRDWIFVDDHNDAIMEIIKLGIPGKVYNIGANEELSNYQLACLICREMKVNPDTEIEFVKDRPGHDFRYAIDSHKIRTELDWYPKIPFEQGIQTTIKWYKNEHTRNNTVSGK